MSPFDKGYSESHESFAYADWVLRKKVHPSLTMVKEYFSAGLVALCAATSIVYHFRSDATNAVCRGGLSQSGVSLCFRFLTFQESMFRA